MTRFLKVIHPLKLYIRKCGGTRAKSNLIEIIQVDGEEDANVKSLYRRTDDGQQSIRKAQKLLTDTIQRSHLLK